MLHLEIAKQHEGAFPDAVSPKSLSRTAAGVFYTHEAIGMRLASTAIETTSCERETSLRILDPFCGDGRLVAWSIEAAIAAGWTKFEIDLWDIDQDAVDLAIEGIEAVASSTGADVQITGWSGNTFAKATSISSRWDVVITNPPWDLIKPDRRELAALSESGRSDYVAALKTFDSALIRTYPRSQPARRFAGWGTNLARVGTEVACALTDDDGVCAVVCPSSFFADTNSLALRRWLLEGFELAEVAHFPAEARLFENVDVPCCSFVAKKSRSDCAPTRIVRFDQTRCVCSEATIRLDRGKLASQDFIIPVQFGVDGLNLLSTFQRHPRFAELEGKERGDVWAGRELDETGRKQFLLAEGQHEFVRSRHISRLDQPSFPGDEFVDLSKRQVPDSAGFARIAWRDIARPSQARRIHATVIPPGPITGNSLNVAYIRGEPEPSPRLWALLGVISSFAFEFQVRASLMTNHISLSSVRAARVPELTPQQTEEISGLAQRRALGEKVDAELEATVARAYMLDTTEWSSLLGFFDFGIDEARALRAAWEA